MPAAQAGNGPRQLRTPPLSICVFGGARNGNSPRAIWLATEAGTLLGHRAHRLVYGVGGIGIMGAIANAAAAAGAHITGIIPEFLYERERDRGAPVDHLIITDDLQKRKRLMVDHADAFLVLPGGIGTLDELLEIVTLAYLGCTTKPMALLARDGLWDGLISLFDDLSRRGHADPTAGELLRVFADPNDALDYLERHAAADKRATLLQNEPVEV